MNSLLHSTCPTQGAARAKRLLLLSALITVAVMAGCSETGVEADRSPLKGAPKSTSSASPEPSAMVIDASPVMEAPAPSDRATGGRWENPRRGVVTAGDIDDTLNLSRFRSYQAKTAKTLGLPKTNIADPVRIQLFDEQGKAAPGLSVTLRKPGASVPFYQGISGVDGWVNVFPAVHGTGRLKNVELRAFGEGQGQYTYTFKTGKPTQASMPFKAEGWQPDFVDLVFVFDTTGSMGDELSWLTKEFGGIVQAARRAAPGADMRFGLVAYRDKGDAYVVKNFGFTQRQGQMQSWLRSLDANGGGDYPEAAAAALQSAVNLNWRRGKGERLLFHIADAPSHTSEARSYLKAAESAARKNVQIFGLGASGVAEESEFLMRQAALVTAGRYLFLTDDSGVGLSHAEPSIACYRVTRLKSLLTRVLASELTGARQEARGSEVMRDVGSYRSGVCAQ